MCVCLCMCVWGVWGVEGAEGVWGVEGVELVEGVEGMEGVEGVEGGARVQAAVKVRVRGRIGSNDVMGVSNKDGQLFDFHSASLLMIYECRRIHEILPSTYPPSTSFPLLSLKWIIR